MFGQSEPAVGGAGHGLLAGLTQAGGFAPQLGNICMDMCMADLTDLPQAQVGSEVEIFGPKNDLNALAQAAGTIPYELMCAVSKRVPRVYDSSEFGVRNSEL